MPIDVAGIFSTDGALLVLKWMFLLGLGIYVIFALVLVRQVAIMMKTVNTESDWIFQLLGYLHLALAIIVWWSAFVTL